MVAGTRVVEWDLVAGRENTWVVQGVGADGVITGVGENGCAFTASEIGVGPALAWHDCPDDLPEWRSGSATITAHAGSLFPLAVGNTESWVYTSRSSGGDSNDEERTCKVTSTVRIATRSGEQDAFKVVCDGRRHTRTAYFDVDGRLVRATQTSKKRGVLWDKEVLRTELPTV